MADHVEAVTVELLPCPFCGGEGQPSLVQAGGIEWAQVECVNRDCGACGPTPATETQAIAAWNTRTQANEAMRLREALREAHENLLLHEQTGKAHHIAYAFDAIDAALSGDRA